ncbi:MAG: hypothetical protein NZ610_01195 [Candidatus Bipolaricaulota bacterium]|nr:hypothetical protein [Candidatus Bipolaricaulota bacterium]MCS7274008.1 hypothetical protein [Candidatus Bipolaricaulota bacterium]MDW8111361.1 hypothetical protein [Candidatus Bipolaricaulota bacterium]MDW8329219.1 hypothetical protein [Candidatus Bipolaricaulota bacterium]
MLRRSPCAQVSGLHLWPNRFAPGSVTAREMGRRAFDALYRDRVCREDPQRAGASGARSRELFVVSATGSFVSERENADGTRTLAHMAAGMKKLGLLSGSVMVFCAGVLTTS